MLVRVYANEKPKKNGKMGFNLNSCGFKFAIRQTIINKNFLVLKLFLLPGNQHFSISLCTFTIYPVFPFARVQCILQFSVDLFVMLLMHFLCLSIFVWHRYVCSEFLIRSNCLYNDADIFQKFLNVIHLRIQRLPLTRYNSCSS